MGFLAFLTPLLSGIFQPIKDYFAYKQQISQANRDLQLAQIIADKEAIISGNTADTDQRGAYLGSVTRSFRQGTFIFFMVPFMLSMFFPEYAAAMWANFDKIPPEFKQLFFLIYGVIWGLPIAKEHVGLLLSAVGRGLNARREYKIALNETKVAASLRQTLFKQGMTQAQWEAIQVALKAGSEN